MDLFTGDDLRELVGLRFSGCVSIYMPTFPVGHDLQQNPLRFKNKLDDAERRLTELGLRNTDVRDMLVPARQLLDNEAFWKSLDSALMVFLAPGILKVYRVPAAFPELVVVGGRFHLKPALQLLAGDTRFFLLDLDLDGVRIFSGSRYTISRLEYDKLPPGLDQSLMFDTWEKQVQFSGKPSTLSGHPATVFGYGRQTDNFKVNVVNYFHRVDEAVNELIRGTGVPLLLSGVEYLHPLYRRANTYPFLHDHGITVSTRTMSVNELHDHAWRILERHFLEIENERIERYRQLAGEGRPVASKDLKTIVEGARHGRIDVLFVTDGTAHEWGTFDDLNQAIEVHVERQPGDEDLLDSAAINTLLRGGVVYIVKPEEVPADAPAAAILRY